LFAAYLSNYGHYESKNSSSINGTNITTATIVDNIDNSNSHLVYLNFDHEIDIKTVLHNESYYEYYTQEIETPTIIIYIGKVVTMDNPSVGIAESTAGSIVIKAILVEFASGNYVPLDGIPKGSVQKGYINIISIQKKDTSNSIEVKIPKLEA
jgi:hypothetical protein